MKYTRISINTATPAEARSRVMIIYTGGTFGMTYDESGVLIPFDFSLIKEQLPALRNLFLEITVVSFTKPIDSSNISPEHWKAIGEIIFENYQAQDGFVVLHGTDTMAFTASAISFMLPNLAKPVIFTGAQLPISQPRSDARENLITSLEIASAKQDGRPLVPEVCIYFDYQLLRGNRSKKVESMHFDAFESGNYPVLAKAGVKIDYNLAAISTPSTGTLRLLSTFDSSVAILKLFPGISPQMVDAVLNTEGVKAVIVETYGSGNAPTAPWFVHSLKAAVGRGLILLNVSQCPGGMVEQGRYETSKTLADIGVISGGDITLEAAVTKLMLLLAEFGSEETRARIGVSLAGEMA
ncbi:MAG: asparaginase [Bacteroidetes bacterium OLB12]|nr:MAG: asparaginase [Bacteroidetes bacterium OLB12]HNR72698.1 asparaginase [Cyclobacteriaceae bacterium]